MKKTVCLLVIFLSGCACKSPEIKVLDGYDPKLKQLNCQQLEFAMSEAAFFLRSIDRKEYNTEAYARTPQCLVATQMKITRATEGAKDRLDFLSTIYQEKKCEKSVRETSEATTKAQEEKFINTKLPVVQKQ